MKYRILSLSLAALLASCSDLVDGINQDPNNPTSAAYPYILTGAEVGNIVLQTGESARRAGIFCGYYTGIDRQHLGFSTYIMTASDFNALWQDVYVNAYRNALEAEKVASESGVKGVTQGILQVLRAHIIGTATALYGDIPFQDAGRVEIDHPKYADQRSVYAELQTLLDEAIKNLDSGTGRPAAKSEIYFDGNPLKWKEVAYTLKARYYLHVKNYSAALEAAKKGITAFSNSLYAPHGTAAGNANLTYQFFAVQVRGADVRVSNFFNSLLQANPATNPSIANYRGNAKTNETARFNFYFRTNSVGVQPNTLANGFAAQTAPAPLVTYQENLLILAECSFRTQGFDAGLQALNNFRAFLRTGGYLGAVNTADLRYDAYVAADFAAGGIENKSGLSANDALLREIMEERYVTFFGQIEGFNDLRRTLKESNIRVPVAPNKGSELPQRFLYPQSEIDRNAQTPNPIPSLFQATPINQ